MHIADCFLGYSRYTLTTIRIISKGNDVLQNDISVNVFVKLQLPNCNVLLLQRQHPKQTNYKDVDFLKWTVDFY